MSFQTSYPACFSTTLEDLAGAGLNNVISLEDLAGRASLSLSIHARSALGPSTPLRDLGGQAYRYC